MDGSPSYPTCFDPYLRYAISTEFRDFGDAGDFKLLLLVELKKEGAAKEFVANLRKALAGREGVKAPFVGVGPTHPKLPYCSLRTDMAAVWSNDEKKREDVYAVWTRYVMRVELSLPLQPYAEKVSDLKLQRRWSPNARSRRIIGVLDDGCPFAAAQYAGLAGTRVRGIWDQNQGKKAVRWPDETGASCTFGETPVDFNYGLEFRRESGSAGMPMRQLGLDEWISLHRTFSGGIDEEACYANGGFSRLRGRESHGAHVMDVLVGRVPVSSRIGHSDPLGRRFDPPSWMPINDAATDADIVFVQFADSCLRDSTGVWLKTYVWEAIWYVMSFADPSTEQVTINISYGPTTGPHDGSALLEQMLQALVTFFDGSANRPKLQIVLAGGNSYDAENHIHYQSTGKTPASIEWVWRIPPDNPVVCFSEIWIDGPQGVSVTLTPPGGKPGAIAQLTYANNIMWRLEVGPTSAGPAAAAHGDYVIAVTGISPGAKVDAYVARTDPNFGIRTGAKRSYFIDAQWQKSRAAWASFSYADGEFDRSGSLVERYGTLNGIATATHDRIHVAGGYILSHARKAPYASAGPARAGALRQGPDFALVCDESYALQGVRAGGNRSGTSFRLIGTSAAAPQLARHVAKGAVPPPYPTDTPGTPIGKQKRGQGNLQPP